MTDLFGDDGRGGNGSGPPKRRKKKPDAAPPDGRVQHCIDAFYDGYVRKWSPPDAVAAWERDRTQKAGIVTPRVIGGKHGRRFKELLAAWDEPTVLDLIRRFFATADDAITRTDYSYDAFFAKADYLRLAAVRRPAGDRLRRNAAAIARGLGLDDARALPAGRKGRDT